MLAAPAHSGGQGTECTGQRGARKGGPPAGPSQGACAPQLQALRSTTRHDSQIQTPCMHRQRLGRSWRHPHTAAHRAQSAPARGGHVRGGRRPGQARAPVRHNCRRCAAQHGMIRNPGWQIHAGVPGPARARHIAPRPHTPGRGKEPGSYCCPLLPSVAGRPARAAGIAWDHTPCVTPTHKLSARAKHGNVVVAYPRRPGTTGTRPARRWGVRAAP